MTIRKTIQYGKAYKFVDHAAEHNPFTLRAQCSLKRH